MENKPVIRIASRKILPEYEERYFNWYKEVFAPLLITVEGYQEIRYYKTIGNNHSYDSNVVLVHFQSIDDWMKAQQDPKYKEVMKDIDTWSNRSVITLSALYQMVACFDDIPQFIKGKNQFKVEDAPIMHLEGFSFTGGEADRYNDWFKFWGNEVYIPLFFKLPGLKQYAIYKFTHEYSPMSQTTTVPVDYPPYISIVHFDNLESFSNYEKSRELLAFKQGLRADFPNGLKHKWYVQYQ